MLQVCFDCYGTYTTDSVYQWDLNRRLAIHGLDYDSAPAIHFSNKKSTEALVVQSTIEDGVIYCDVPNILLQEPYDIVGYVCECLDQELTTYETIRIPVKPRVKPADYAYENNVEILTYYSLMSEITSVKASTEKDLNSMDASKASKAELNAVKSEVENNMDTNINRVENEIASERARIDQLVASPEIGEGDLEKEVGDLRIDTKGTTHGSAGTAVRVQIQELDSKIDNNARTLSSEIVEVETQLSDAISWEYLFENKVINNSGEITENNARLLSKDIFEVKTSQTFTIGGGYAFRFIRYQNGEWVSNDSTWRTTWTPSADQANNYQFRINIYNPDAPNVAISAKDVSPYITTNMNVGKKTYKCATLEELQKAEKTALNNRNNIKIKKPQICFMFDDGNSSDVQVHDLFSSYGITCGFALIANSDYTTDGKVTRYLSYQNEGFEIISHSTDTAGMEGVVSETDIDAIVAKMRDSKIWLEERGFDISGWVTPGNELDNTVLKERVAETYEYAVTRRANYGTEYETPYCNFTDSTNNLYRCGLEFMETSAIKQAIDEVCNNGGLLILYGHELPSTRGVGLDLSKLSSILDYVISQKDLGLCNISNPSECIADFYTVTHKEWMMLYNMCVN